MTVIKANGRLVTLPAALVCALLSFSCHSCPETTASHEATAENPEMNYLEQIAELGAGAKRLDIFVVPGIFEGASYAKALAARLRTDAENDGACRRLLAGHSIHLTTVLAPGYHPEDQGRGVSPDNDIYLSRIRETYDSLPPDSVKILIAHSWGGATCLSGSLWTDKAEAELPDLAVFVAPAWSDHVGFVSRISGMILGIPLSQYPARFLTRIIGYKTLMDSPLPEVRAIAIGMPDLFCSRGVAYQSYRRVREGPSLGSHDAESLRKLLRESGEKVTIIQGTKDFALNGPKVLATLESIGELDKLSENTRVLRKDLDHWPLLENPGLLGEVIEAALLQPSD
ncbi:MAG: alpha/beta fold hydrolase [Planctomycetota bacterium]